MPTGFRQLQPAHHLGEVVQQLQAVEDDDRAADLVDDVEHLLVEAAAQQGDDGGQ